MRVVVVTIVHHPLDARIFHRQIGALLEAGHEVVYVAPWSATGAAAPPALRAVDVPRSVGRRRLGAVLAARRVVRRERAEADLILLHDPELLLAVIGMRRPPTVWDVHEDTAVSLVDKAWVPRPMRRWLSWSVRRGERFAERRFGLLLAEEEYRGRFRRTHPVVPNEPRVPERIAEPGDDRVVYVGRLSRGRGVETLLALPPLLPAGVTVELVGPADADVVEALDEADRDGTLRWRHFVPNDEAQELLDGALAGLSLLRDLPNYRHSRPTKVVEYMAHGVPVVTTPAPVAERIVREHGCGVVVPYDDPEAVAAAVGQLREDPQCRREMGQRGHDAARAHFDWAVSGPAFVALLESWAGIPGSPAGGRPRGRGPLERAPSRSLRGRSASIVDIRHGHGEHRRERR